MPLADRTGLDDLLACLHERSRAIGDPPPLPPELSEMHEWMEWLHDGGEGFWNPDEPCPGFFKMRLVNKGPYVPVVVWRDQARAWRGWVDDELWPMDGRLMYPRMITETKFLTMHIERLAALKSGDPTHWRLRTRTPLDMTRI